MRMDGHGLLNLSFSTQRTKSEKSDQIKRFKDIIKQIMKKKINIDINSRVFSVMDRNL